MVDGKTVYDNTTRLFIKSFLYNGKLIHQGNKSILNLRRYWTQQNTPDIQEISNVPAKAFFRSVNSKKEWKGSDLFLHITRCNQRWHCDDTEWYYPWWLFASKLLSFLQKLTSEWTLRWTCTSSLKKKTFWFRAGTPRDSEAVRRAKRKVKTWSCPQTIS